MSTKKIIQHNKKRNSGLMYEFLVYHVSKCLAENNSKEANKAIGIIKKYFKDTLIAEEYKLFKSIIDSKFQSRDVALRLLDEVGSCYSRINLGKLEQEKSKLIKEINYSFGQDKIYDYKVPNYSLYASISVFLNNNKKGAPLTESSVKIKIEDVLVTYLTENKKQEKQDKQVYSDFVYKIIVNKFNEKYNNKLNENQKKFLNKYIVCSINENGEEFNKAINEQTNNIKNKLLIVKDEQVKNDKVLMSKLNECYEKFNSTKFDFSNSESVVEFLQYMDLVEEIEKN